MHAGLIAVRERRTRLRRMMALEIEGAPEMLKLYKLSGLSLITTYALIAIIGDIGRFKSSKNLVSYIGLNPSVVESGDSEGSGALKSHGRGSLRALIIQAARRLLTTQNPLQKWGLSVAMRRGTNRAAVAVARKLVTAVWHLLKGHWSQAFEETTTLTTKLQKLATELGVAGAQGTRLRGQGAVPGKETLPAKDYAMSPQTSRPPAGSVKDGGTTFPPNPLLSGEHLGSTTYNQGETTKNHQLIH